MVDRDKPGEDPVESLPLLRRRHPMNLGRLSDHSDPAILR